MLDSTRNPFSAQLQYADQEVLALNTVIDVCKAMGGGWVTLADAEATATDAKPALVSATTPH